MNWYVFVYILGALLTWAAGFLFVFDDTYSEEKRTDAMCGLCFVALVWPMAVPITLGVGAFAILTYASTQLHAKIQRYRANRRKRQPRPETNTPYRD